MRLPAIILVILLFSLPIYSQTYRMYGNILDKETGEVLVGAHLYRENKSGQKIGAITNAYGFYSMSVEAGKNTIHCSMMGYTTYMDTLWVERDTIVNIKLEKSSNALQDVVVYADAGNKSSYTSLTPTRINQIPTIGGDPDLLKGILFEPGVTSGNDGSNNLSVREATSGKTCICWTKLVCIIPIMLCLFSRCLIRMPYGRPIFINRTSRLPLEADCRLSWM